MPFKPTAAVMIAILLAGAGCKKNPPPAPPAPPAPAAKKTVPRPQPQSETPPAPVTPETPQPSEPPKRRPSPFPEATTAPQLGQVLSPQQQQSYARAIDVSLSRAKQALAVLATRRLSDSLKAEMSRIESFVKQAEQYRATDLITAKNLAERADLLARDLVGRSR
jgi:hypothetical protein